MSRRTTQITGTHKRPRGNDTSASSKPQETYIRVRAHAGARRTAALRIAPLVWDISVRERPEQGAANASIREVLAKELDVMPNRLRLVKGATKASKLYLLL